MAITPTTATTKKSPERISSGFQRTVIGLYSFGSSCRAARHGRRRAEGPSGPSGGPSIRGVGNRQEILGNNHGNQVQKVRERPGTGSSAQASERRCEWEGATPFALIPRRGRIPLPLNPRIRAPHTIDIPRPDIKRNIFRMAVSREFTLRRERIDSSAARHPPGRAHSRVAPASFRQAPHPLLLRDREWGSLADKEPSPSAANLLILMG